MAAEALLKLEKARAVEAAVEECRCHEGGNFGPTHTKRVCGRERFESEARRILVGAPPDEDEDDAGVEQCSSVLYFCSSV